VLVTIQLGLVNKVWNIKALNNIKAFNFHLIIF